MAFFLISFIDKTQEEFLKKSLESLGHTVTVAPDGKEATEAPAFNDFDVIFLEVHQVGRNVIDVISGILGYDDTEVITVCGRIEDSALIQECIVRGAYAQFQIPFDESTRKSLKAFIKEVA